MLHAPICHYLPLPTWGSAVAAPRLVAARRAGRPPAVPPHPPSPMHRSVSTPAHLADAAIDDLIALIEANLWSLPTTPARRPPPPKPFTDPGPRVLPYAYRTLARATKSLLHAACCVCHDALAAHDCRPVELACGCLAHPECLHELVGFHLERARSTRPFPACPSCGALARPLDPAVAERYAAKALLHTALARADTLPVFSALSVTLLPRPLRPARSTHRASAASTLLPVLASVGLRPAAEWDHGATTPTPCRPPRFPSVLGTGPPPATPAVLLPAPSPPSVPRLRHSMVSVSSADSDILRINQLLGREWQ